MFFKQKILKVYLFRKKHAICVNKDETLCLGKHLILYKRRGCAALYSCPDSTSRTMRSVSLSAPSGSYSFFRLALKTQANAW